ncbi:MAG: hypothetical protein ACUVQG_10340 [Thermogutta sp.]
MRRGVFALLGVVIFALLLVGTALGGCSQLPQFFRQLCDTVKKSVPPLLKENPAVQQAQDRNNQNHGDLYNTLVSLIEWPESEVWNVEEDKRNKALEVFYRWVYNREDVPKQGTQEGDLQDAFKKLSQEEGGNRGFNPLGLLSEKEQATARELDLDKIDPVKLRKAFRALIELRKSDLEPAQLGTDTRYGKALDELRKIQPPQVPDGPKPKFYVSKDLDHAKLLENLLSSGAWRDLIGGDPRDKKLGGLLSAVRDARRDKNSVVAKETLDSYTKVSSGSKVQNWCSKLGEFLEVCAAAAPDPQDLKVIGRSSE